MLVVMSCQSVCQLWRVEFFIRRRTMFAMGGSFFVFCLGFHLELYLCFLTAVCLLLAASLLESESCLHQPQLISQSVACKAETSQVCQTLTIHGGHKASAHTKVKHSHLATQKLLKQGETMPRQNKTCPETLHC